MKKLKKIMDACKCGVHLSINEHKNYYETVEQYLSEENFNDVAADLRQAMIDTNTIIELILFPNTPVGSIRIVHFDLERVFETARKALNISSEEFES